MLLITLQCPSGKDKSLSSFTDQIYRLFDTSTVSVQASYTVHVHSVNDVQTLPTLARIIQDMEKEKDEVVVVRCDDELKECCVLEEKEGVVCLRVDLTNERWLLSSQEERCVSVVSFVRIMD